MNSEKSWVCEVDPDIQKELTRFPRSDAARLLDVFETLALDPYAGDIQKIKGKENEWRRRVGAYRLFYDVYPARRYIHVTWVERRTSNTY